MTAARFFVDAPLAPDTEIALPTAVAHHAVRVLRLRDGAPIVLFNGTGGEFAARLTVDRRNGRGRASPLMIGRARVPLAITLVSPGSPPTSSTGLVEKSIELGVGAIALAPARRSVVRLWRPAARRIDHLREWRSPLAASAAAIASPASPRHPDLASALHSALDGGARGVLLDPQSDDAGGTIGGASMSLAVGPEARFDDSEIAAAMRFGYRGFRLGPRTLRTETAAVAALCALRPAAGDFAPDGWTP
jgi:16S rRNA (uracil1498-N3)-methyltransferase